MTTLWPIPVLSDNYVWILGESGSDVVAVIDPGDAVPVLDSLERRGLRPACVMLTHHHHDHVGGAETIATKYAIPVFGPAAAPISAMTHPVRDGDIIAVPETTIHLTVLDVPGHTAQHSAFAGDGFVLVGDTLFAGGCGRIFEGTPQQMFASLNRLTALDPGTLVYCAHEYTTANLDFAIAVEPGNDRLTERRSETADLRASGTPTVPSSLNLELATNPFLRCSEPGVVAAASRHTGRKLAPGLQTFAAIRAWKDSFR